ncbi:DUF86 domain-containing protein [candidate division KSB1 bacterium]|nr:DUF86 domain-containing protein [candidate division KSB1 bacterium]
MKNEFNGIERRLDELSERLARLEPLKKKTQNDILADPYLVDIIERNLEVIIQCCIDICNRIISLQDAVKPRDYYESIIRLGEIGILPLDFAQKFAPITGFRNVLIHEYLEIDWDIVFNHFQSLHDFFLFMNYIKKWMKND